MQEVVVDMVVVQVEMDLTVPITMRTVGPDMEVIVDMGVVGTPMDMEAVEDMEEGVEEGNLVVLKLVGLEANHQTMVMVMAMVTETKGQIEHTTHIKASHSIYVVY